MTDDYFGTSVASVGDLDGDGVTDLAVGAYGDDDGGINRGAVWMLFLDAPKDFGDAPDSPYPTLLASDGARHLATGPRLGTGRDTEVDGQPTAGALGDDNNGVPDDEDGVSFASPLIVSQSAGKTGSVTVDASAAAKLDAWIDFNQDGDWADSGEQIFAELFRVGGEPRLLLYHSRRGLRRPHLFPLPAQHGRRPPRDRPRRRRGSRRPPGYLRARTDDHRCHPG